MDGQLADELDQTQLASQINVKLQAELSQWLDPKMPARHFHYGYFVYAASVAVKHDAQFKTKIEPMVNVLIRDYGGPDQTGQLPKLRTYDNYVGHAWADGFGDTLDGNNQESSSEAVNSAYAIKLWGDVTRNQKLADFGQWLYQNQANTATQYWLSIDKSKPPFDGVYKPSIVSMVWQGKLDYATFFSDKPTAKLGIQLIPMSPAQQYLATDKAATHRNLTGVSQSDSLGDYLLMYQAQTEPTEALKKLETSPPPVDDGNSLSYIYAWIYRQL